MVPLAKSPQSPSVKMRIAVETLQTAKHKSARNLENNSLVSPNHDIDQREIESEKKDADSISVRELPSTAPCRIESKWGCNTGFFSGGQRDLLCGSSYCTSEKNDIRDINEASSESRPVPGASHNGEGSVQSKIDEATDGEEPMNDQTYRSFAGNISDSAISPATTLQPLLPISADSQYDTKSKIFREGSPDTIRYRELFPPRLPPRATVLGARCNQTEDATSTTVVPVLGSHIFSDVSSLFSVTNSAMQKEDDMDDAVSVVSTGDISTISFPNQKEDATAKLETLADEKLNQVDVKETIGEVPQSAAALIRQSSSLSRNRSFRRRKKNEKRNSDDSSVASSVASTSSKALSSTMDPSFAMESEIDRTSFLVRKLKSTIRSHGRYDVKCAKVTISLGKIYEGGNEFGQAHKLYSEAISIYSTKLGDNHATTIDSKVRLAKVMDKMGSFEGAISLYSHILSMRKATLGENDPSVADTMSFIAHTLRGQGRLIQAIKELKRALKVYRSALGDSHPQVINTVDEIASLYVAAGDYTKATAILEEVVKLKAGISGINTIDVATTLLQLANAYKAAGDHHKELRALKKCYSVFTAVCGEDSDEAMSILEKIASTYKLLGDSEKAVTAYLTLLRTRKDKLGDSHPSIAQTYLQLGIALRLNQQPSKARKCMKQALSIYVAEGSEMNDVGMIAEVMHEMALNSIATGDLQGGVKILKQELGIRKKIGKSDNHNIARTLYHLGTTEIQLRNYNKALHFFMDALSIHEKMDNEIGIAFARTLYCTGIVFEAIRDKKSAEEAFKESTKIIEGLGLSESEVNDILSEFDTLRNVDPDRSVNRKMFGSVKRK
mmetsp:Transcript_10220/g.15009  ORF Transcript_10220/g.15009 Transcript_10220/m.15009 type:complete len:840 (-) Transcript_10220:56-2575(-)